MLRDTLAQKWEQIQGSLFPRLAEEIVGHISREAVRGKLQQSTTGSTHLYLQAMDEVKGESVEQI